MKNAIFFLFFTVIATFGFAQNIKSEAEYLYLINVQKNTEIIKDNLRNAEITAEKIIQEPDSFNKTNEIKFFQQLAESYLTAKQAERALYSIARQICFFPDESSDYSQSIINLSCEKASIKDAKEIYEKLLTPRSNKYEILFKTVISSKIHNIDDLLLKDISAYKKKTNKPLPDWLKQYEFYTKIGITPNTKFDMISFKEKSETFLFSHEGLSLKNKRILLAKSADYFIDIKNKEMEAKCLTEYKKTKKGLYHSFLYALYKFNYLFL